MPFRLFKKLDTPDITPIVPEVHHNDRGLLMEPFKGSVYLSEEVYIGIIQINISFSRNVTVRDCTIS